MPYIIAVAYILGTAIGIIAMYLVIREAVKDGIIAADKARNKKV